MWHRFLCFLGIRNEFDYAPPGLGPEVNHPYEQHAAVRCCVHCGGGELHAIHKTPYDPRRLAQILAVQNAMASLEQIKRHYEITPRGYEERER